MNGNPFLISNPSAMEWLIGLAYIVILGLVAAVVVWRTHRPIRTYAVNRIEKGSHLTRSLEQIHTPGLGNVPFDQSGKPLLLFRASRTKELSKITRCSNYYLLVSSI